MNNKPIIIAIVGESGSGKTSLSFHLNDVMHIPYVCSYTTRPKRQNETNGRDHWFVTDTQVPEQAKTLAFTNFGGFAYWTMPSQIDGQELVSYVIDERGLIDLKHKWRREYNIISVNVMRPGNPTEQARKDRDRGRVNYKTYDITITNNGTLAEFYATATHKISQFLDFYYRD